MLKRTLLIFASAIVSLIAGLVGPGVASADSPFYGQTYEKASSKIESKGGTAAIETVIGGQLPTSDCIVTNAHKSITLDSRGGYAHKGTWLFALNCNLAVAQPGKPGNSVATPEGEWAKSVQVKATKISKDFAKATEEGTAPVCESRAADCQKICTQSGTCSAELLKYLASL